MRDPALPPARLVAMAEQPLLAPWIMPQGARRVVMMIVVAVLVAAVGGVVYVTGGIKYVYAHAMYLIYVSPLVKRYNTDQNILYTLQFF